MKKKISRSFEVLAARLAPGFINVYCITLLAGWMSTNEYGLFSTSLATSGLISNILFGGIKSGILPIYADFEKNGDEKKFESTILGATLLVTFTLATIGWILTYAGLVSVWVPILIISLGIQGSIQPIHQASIQFWRYGASSILQSISLIILIWYLVKPEPNISQALMSYAISYIIGFIASYSLMGLPWPRLPDFAVLKKTFSIGIPFTIATLSESILLLGFRYVIILFGSPTLLTIFSFSVDLAQRFVGVIISITSFTITPLAYRADAEGNHGEFKKILISGTFFSLILASISTLLIIAISWTGIFPALNQDNFSTIAFLFCSLSVIINRLKKIAIDPVVTRRGKPTAIPLGYAVAGPAMITMACIALNSNQDNLIYPIYLSGYILAAAITFHSREY